MMSSQKIECDILIPAWNQLEFTRECIENVLKRTKVPFHLIIIDNGSSEATKDYLKKLAEDKKDVFTLIRNERNLGFVKAANQGLRASSAPYVCLLNNDTRVTEGWLTEMIKVSEGSKDVGIVNPSSNTFGRKPKRGQTVEALAQELKSNTGIFAELAWATGFCMLIKREVLEKVGLFDEIYGMGNFEDADFSKRAQGLGYISVCARAAYVFHRERRSFVKFKEFNQDFRRNRQIFFAKWGKIERILYVLSKDKLLHSKEIDQQALKLARAGNTVWFFLRYKQNLESHSNIHVYLLPGKFFNVVSFWRIIKRKKKFNKIYVDDENYGKRLNVFKTFHKAEVIYVQ